MGIKVRLMAIDRCGIISWPSTFYQQILDKVFQDIRGRENEKILLLIDHGHKLPPVASTLCHHEPFYMKNKSE